MMLIKTERKSAWPKALAIPDDCKFLFESTGAKKWLYRDRTQRPNAIFPTTAKGEGQAIPGSSDFLYSTDPRFLNVTEELAHECTRRFPIDLKGNGFAGETAVGATFLGLLNVSGIGMNPLPIPISNNDAWVQANGIAEKISRVTFHGSTRSWISSSAT